MNPLVSIIVPVYNAGIYLEPCIKSIINQTYSHIEIICVDDSSTDNSLEKLRDFAAQDNRIRVYQKHNVGKGAASGRNFGIEKASGKYLLFLDHDDFFENKLVETLVQTAEKYNTDIAMCDALSYDDLTGKTKGNVALNRDYLPDKQVFNWRVYPESIFQISAPPAWNSLFLREFVIKNNICFQDLKMTDDMYFTYLARILAERICVVPEYLVYWRINIPSSQSARLNDYPDSAYFSFTTLRNSYNTIGIYDQIERSFLNRASVVFRYVYDKLTDFGSFERFHEQLKSVIFPDLGITGKTSEYFYDPRAWSWLELIFNNTAGQILLNAANEAAKKLELPGTTAVLRF